MGTRTAATITTTTPALPRPKGAREACPVQTREGEEGREGERGAISVLNCILDFSLSAIKSVEKRGREGASRRAAMLCCCGVGIGKRKQCLARSATLFTAQTLSSEFEGRERERESTGLLLHANRGRPEPEFRLPRWSGSMLNYHVFLGGGPSSTRLTSQS